jgi:hypothetical protein
VEEHLSVLVRILETIWKVFPTGGKLQDKAGKSVFNTTVDSVFWGFKFGLRVRKAD